MSISEKDLLYFQVNELRRFSGSNYDLRLTVRRGTAAPKDIDLTVRGRVTVSSLEDTADVLVKSVQHQLQEQYSISNEDLSLESLNPNHNGMMRALAQNRAFIEDVQMGARRVIRFRNFRNSGTTGSTFEFDCFSEPVVIRELEKLGMTPPSRKGCQKIQPFIRPDVSNLSKDQLYRFIEKELRFQPAEFQPEEKLNLGHALSTAKKEHRKILSRRRRQRIGLPLLTIFLLMLSIGLYQNSRMKQDRDLWNAARLDDQPERYLAEFPLGYYASDAIKLLDSRRWEAAREEGTDYFLQQYLFENTGYSKYFRDSALAIMKNREALTDGEVRSFVGKRFSGFFREYNRQIIFDFQEHRPFDRFDQIEGRILQTKTSPFDELPKTIFHIGKTHRTLSIVDKPLNIPMLKIYKRDGKYFMETKSREDPYLRLSE